MSGLPRRMSDNTTDHTRWCNSVRGMQNCLEGGVHAHAPTRQTYIYMGHTMRMHIQMQMQMGGGRK